MEAWELLLAFAAAFVAGYLGSMLGLVLGTLRLPFIVLATGSPLARRRHEHRDLGRRGRSRRPAACAGGTRGLARGRLDRVPVGRPAPSLGALLADDVSESLLVRADRRRPPLERDRPRAQADRSARPQRRLRLGRGVALSSLIGAARRRGRSHPRNVAHAGTHPLGRNGHPARRGHEPRRRLPARRRRLRDARGRTAESTGRSSPRVSPARSPAAGWAPAPPAACRRTPFGSRSASSSWSSGSRSPCRRSSSRRQATAGQLAPSHSTSSSAGPRARDVEALRVVAAPVGEHAPGVARLDALGDDLQAERVADVDDAAHESCVGDALAEPVDEPDVDLQLVEREHAQRRERGGAAGVVEREPDAERVEAAEHLLVDLRAGARPGRDHLERDALRADVVGAAASSPRPSANCGSSRSRYGMLIDTPRS